MVYQCKEPDMINTTLDNGNLRQLTIGVHLFVAFQAIGKS